MTKLSITPLAPQMFELPLLNMVVVIARAANDVIANFRDEFGDRLQYVFRHKPLPGRDLARRAAELVERTTSDKQFWEMHVRLMIGSEVWAEERLRVVAAALDHEFESPAELEDAEQRAINKVDADLASFDADGILVTPTFFHKRLARQRALGPTLADRGDTLNTRSECAATVDFIHWDPPAGVLLLIATVLAVGVTNSPYGPTFAEFWKQNLGLSTGDIGFKLSPQDWVNDGLLTLFFLVVGLEINAS